MKKSASNVKEKMIKLFEAKIDNNIPNGYKPKKIASAFDDNYIKYKIKGDEKLSIEQYLENVRPYLHDMIDNLKISGEWKIHLTMKTNFMTLHIS